MLNNVILYKTYAQDVKRYPIKKYGGNKIWQE